MDTVLEISIANISGTISSLIRVCRPEIIFQSVRRVDIQILAHPQHKLG